MKKVLFICGNSGSGKTFITNSLIERFSHLFYKFEQYTTRPKRENEADDAYRFISKKEYNELTDIFAKTMVNGNLYGSIPNFIEDKIGIAVVNDAGLRDGMYYMERLNIPYRIIFLRNNIPFETRVDSRDVELESYLLTSTLSRLDKRLYDIVDNNSENPIDVLDVISHIKELFDTNYELNNRFIKCEWITCIHNVNGECKFNGELRLISKDVPSEVLGELLPDGEQYLDCKEYKFDKNWINKK